MERALLCVLALLLAPAGDASPRAKAGLCRDIPSTASSSSVGGSQCQKLLDGANAEFSCSAEEAHLRQQPCAPRTVPLKSATTTQGQGGTTQGYGATTESPGTTRSPAKKTRESLWILIFVLVALVICCGIGIWICCLEDTPTPTRNMICNSHQLTGWRNIDSLATLSDIITQPPCNEDQNIDDDENQEPFPLPSVAAGLPQPPDVAAGLPPPLDVAAGLPPPLLITRRFRRYTDDPPPYSLENPFPPPSSASPDAPFHHIQSGNPGDKKDSKMHLNFVTTRSPGDEAGAQSLLDFFHHFYPGPALGTGSLTKQSSSWRSVSPDEP